MTHFIWTSRLNICGLFGLAPVSVLTFQDRTPPIEVPSQTLIKSNAWNISLKVNAAHLLCS